MGQSECHNCCTEKTNGIHSLIETKESVDQPKPTFAKAVKHSINIHPNVRSVFLKNKNDHSHCRKGNKLSLYYLFEFAAYYQGQWKNGLPEGYGRLVYDDGSVYQGCFKSGNACCKEALYIKENGSFYQGEVLNNKAHGKGNFTKESLYYEGQWFQDYPDGQGKEIYPNKQYYIGQFKGGEKHGVGEYHWNDDQYYKGEFRKGKMDGWGTHITQQYEYQGDFKEGIKEGTGTMKNKLKGWRYDGQFKHNRFEGKGIYKWKDGTAFHGQFSNNKKIKGKLISSNGQQLEQLA